MALTGHSLPPEIWEASCRQPGCQLLDFLPAAGEAALPGRLAGVSASWTSGGRNDYTCAYSTTGEPRVLDTMIRYPDTPAAAALPAMEYPMAVICCVQEFFQCLLLTDQVASRSYGNTFLCRC